jgi:hypothetical protein
MAAFDGVPCGPQALAGYLTTKDVGPVRAGRCVAPPAIITELVERQDLSEAHEFVGGLSIDRHSGEM